MKKGLSTCCLTPTFSSHQPYVAYGNVSKGDMTNTSIALTDWWVIVSEIKDRTQNQYKKLKKSYGKK